MDFNKLLQLIGLGQPTVPTTIPNIDPEIEGLLEQKIMDSGNMLLVDRIPDDELLALQDNMDLSNDNMKRVEAEIFKRGRERGLLQNEQVDQGMLERRRREQEMIDQAIRESLI